MFFPDISLETLFLLYYHIRKRLAFKLSYKHVIFYIKAEDKTQEKQNCKKCLFCFSKVIHFFFKVYLKLNAMYFILPEA